MSYLRSRDGTKIFYTDLGEGQPVVLIHGWPLNADMWEYQIPGLLAQGFRVVAYDRRGFGRSGKPAGPYDYDIFAEDLDALMTELDLEQAALIGFSMGGGEIARYLSRFGAARVAKVVLISSVVPYLLKDESNPDGVDVTELDKMQKGLREDRPKFLAAFNKQFFGVGMVSKPVSDELMQWCATLAYQASPIATHDCVDAFGKTDFRPDLPAFTVPTMVIHGTSDKTVPIDPAGKAAGAAIAGAVFRPYEGAPHGLFITHKEQLTDDILQFLGEPRPVAKPRRATEKTRAAARAPH